METKSLAEMPPFTSTWPYPQVISSAWVCQIELTTTVINTRKMPSVKEALRQPPGLSLTCVPLLSEQGGECHSQFSPRLIITIIGGIPHCVGTKVPSSGVPELALWCGWHLRLAVKEKGNTCVMVSSLTWCCCNRHGVGVRHFLD